MLEDNNDFALALVLSLPLLYYLASTSDDARIKTFLPLAIGLTLIAILLTHSRGAFLATVMVALAIARRTGKLVQAGGALLVLGVLFFLFVPDHVLERLSTIKEGGAESSAGARIRAWTVALRMVGANPVFGVGLRNFRANWHDHAYGLGEPPGGGFAFVAHNSYLQIWAEGGTIAFLVYLGLLASVFVSCRYLRAVSRQRPDLEWIGAYARMFEVVTIGFMVGATFLNRGHFDLIYHLFALVSCTVFIAGLEYRRGAPATSEAQPGPREITVRWGSATPARSGRFEPRPSAAAPAAEGSFGPGGSLAGGSAAPAGEGPPIRVRRRTGDASSPGSDSGGAGNSRLLPRWGR